MIDKLKKLGFNTAPTLNEFVKKGVSKKAIVDYAKFLDEIPKRTDFISFDDEGFALNENEPIFKDWDVCEDASSESIKVAKQDNIRIYFDTKDGVIVASHTNMSDQVTYNDLFIFFEGKLGLS